MRKVKSLQKQQPNKVLTYLLPVLRVCNNMYADQLVANSLREAFRRIVVIEQRARIALATVFPVLSREHVEG
jgi:hypothetical protein